jgi:hypothetical protein
MKDQGLAHGVWENTLLWKLKISKAQTDKWKEKKVVVHSLSSIINALLECQMSKDCKANNSGLNTGWLRKVDTIHTYYQGICYTFWVAIVQLSKMYSVSVFFQRWVASPRWIVGSSLR